MTANGSRCFRDMTSTRILFFALSLFVLLVASERGLAADVAAGKAVAEGCAGCHGADGVSQMPLTPSLAGQRDEYIQWQIVYFRSGARKSEVMQPIAEALKNEEIRNLGAYYASLKPPKPEATSASDALAQQGKKIAAQQRCRSCHSDDFSGYRSGARLASQREDVLLKALRDFKSGVRVGTGVASMADVVYALSDDDMKALAHFMATRP
jgi:cytochrome c553